PGARFGPGRARGVRVHPSRRRWAPAVVAAAVAPLVFAAALAAPPASAGPATPATAVGRPVPLLHGTCAGCAPPPRPRAGSRCPAGRAAGPPAGVRLRAPLAGDPG